MNGGRLSPLQSVAMHGHFEAAQLLLEAKAAPGCVAGALKLDENRRCSKIFKQLQGILGECLGF